MKGAWAGRVLSGRERETAVVAGAGVVYFKFFQTLGRTRRERKKASVAKKRSWSAGSGKEGKKGKKERKVGHRELRGRRYRGNRAKRARKKGDSTLLLLRTIRQILYIAVESSFRVLLFSSPLLVVTGYWAIFD